MSEEIIPTTVSTIPDNLETKSLELKQTIVRLHPHDHTLAKTMLKKDKLSFQKFIGLCVRGYLDADPQLMKMLKSYREIDTIPQHVQDNHVLSHRERLDIYKELESTEKVSE